MDFDLTQGTAMLARTPKILEAWLADLAPEWTTGNEGPGSWSPFDIVGHLIHGERTDWIPRARIILERGEGRAFDPYDRFAQERESAGKTLGTLLTEFGQLRRENLAALAAMRLTAADLARAGKHPSLGRVTLGQLLATWVTHDLGHLAQIARVMAKQYTAEVGPWNAYLPVLADRPRPAA
jgi:hypothetical protein